jgi:hypothetical protein
MLSMTPAFLVTALMLLEIRIRWRTVLAMIGAAVVVVALAAAIDLTRPARDRTHLGRLITNVRERGLSEITGVIGRKLSRNLDTWTSSNWRLMVLMGFVFVGYLCWWARPELRALVARVPQLRASLAGFGVLLVLGYALNDSGVTIPAVMLVVLVAVLVGLLVRTPGVLFDAEGEGDAQRPASTASVRSATPSH